MFFLSSLFLNAQEEKNEAFRIGYQLGGGFMITHSPIMEYVSEQHYVKHELTIEKRLLGNKDWHQLYGFPYGGLSVVYYNLARKDFFGNAFSVSPYYSFFLIEGEKLSLKLRTTLGVGYIQKSFDLEENYKNVAIGSQLNLFFGVLTQLEYNPSEKWGIHFGLNYSHFSNTAFKTPNLGINLPSADLGINYQFGSSKKPIFKEEIPDVKPDDFFQIRFGAGVNEIYPVNGPNYLASAMSVEWEKVQSRKSNWGFGMDLFYNPAQRAKLAQDSIFIDSGLENLQLGISAHHLLKLGNLGAGFKLGYYFKKEDDELNDFYQEVYGQHKIWNSLSAFVSIKTHLSKAEYLLFGLKYRLN